MPLENVKEAVKEEAIQKDAMKIDMPDEGKTEMPGVEELLKILIEYNMESNVQSVNLLMNYMNEMEEQFNSVMEELSSVKEQLANAQNTPESKQVKSTLTSLSEKLQEKLSSLQEQIHTIRAALNEKAAQLVENFKENGVLALNHVCEFLGIKDTMTQMKETFEQGSADMQGSMDKIDSVSKELRETTTHAKNIGRAMVGKELKEVPEAKQSGFFHNMKKPYQSMKNTYDKGAGKLEKAIARMESLEQSAEKVSEKRAEAKKDAKEKTSIMKKLQSCKENQGSKEKQEPVVAKVKRQEAVL